MPDHTDEHQYLRSYLASEECGNRNLGYAEIQGLLFTVVSAPEVVPPSEWINAVFGGDGPMFESAEQANHIMGDLMSLYNSVNDSVMSDSLSLPKTCAFREPILSNFDDDARVRQWSEGFRQALVAIRAMGDFASRGARGSDGGSPSCVDVLFFPRNRRAMSE